MKKLLLTTAACGLVMAAAPAHAEIDLSIGGYFKGYGAYVNQDDALGGDVNSFDFIRDTEVHFTGETTLDNGLTVGFHVEATADGEDGFDIDESYAYFSGGWGRVNFGDEDGAAYLLQVAAPSADDNIDGIRQFVSPVNYSAIAANAIAAGVPAATVANLGGKFDYAVDPSGKSTKLTYLTPVMNGFQAGLTFAPSTTDAHARDFGVREDNVAGEIEETYEAAVRYEGQFDSVGVILGAGYSHGEANVVDDRKVWNLGADLDIGAFGIGAAYVADKGGDHDKKEKTWVVGVDYTTGPFKIGASYYDQSNSFGIDDLDTKRYSGGVTYTYGPGMTFRGSVGHIDHDWSGDDQDATYVTLGTQINF